MPPPHTVLRWWCMPCMQPMSFSPGTMESSPEPCHTPPGAWLDVAHINTYTYTRIIVTAWLWDALFDCPSMCLSLWVPSKLWMNTCHSHFTKLPPARSWAASHWPQQTLISDAPWLGHRKEKWRFSHFWALKAEPGNLSGLRNGSLCGSSPVLKGLLFLLGQACFLSGSSLLFLDSSPISFPWIKCHSIDHIMWQLNQVLNECLSERYLKEHIDKAGRFNINYAAISKCSCCGYTVQN